MGPEIKGDVDRNRLWSQGTAPQTSFEEMSINKQTYIHVKINICTYLCRHIYQTPFVDFNNGHLA